MVTHTMGNGKAVDEKGLIPTPSQLLGQDTSALAAVPDCGGAVRLLHAAVIEDFVALRNRAAIDGIELHIASAHRSLERQLHIWNAKAKGLRPLYDAQGQFIDVFNADEATIVSAILAWSALPGASRHHWGSDLDIYDNAALEVGASVELDPQEYSPDGCYHRVAAWLESELDSNPDSDFFRPYGSFCGGVQIEPWHISHRLVAGVYRAQLGVEVLAELIANLDMHFKQSVMVNLDEIFDRYIAID